MTPPIDECIKRANAVFKERTGVTIPPPVTQADRIRQAAEHLRDLGNACWNHPEYDRHRPDTFNALILCAPALVGEVTLLELADKLGVTTASPDGVGEETKRLTLAFIRLLVREADQIRNEIRQRHEERLYNA